MLRLYDSPTIKLTTWLVEAGHLSVSWSIGVQLVVFFGSGFSVVLLTPKESLGVSTRCNFESSSLFRHSFFIDFKCCPCRHIYELGDLHASRTANLIV